MLAWMTWLIALLILSSFSTFQWLNREDPRYSGHFIRIGQFALFLLLMAFGLYDWGFRWIGFFLYLSAGLAIGLIQILRRAIPAKPFKKSKAIRNFILEGMVITICLLPALVFPPYAAIVPNGPHAFETTTLTLVDDSRIETFVQTGENRKVSIQFWFPGTNDQETYPLVVFSHGSFGYRGSNQSTFETLASNGYVVCSIDHSFHAFSAQHADGSRSTVDPDFLNDAIQINQGQYDARKTYDLTHQWLILRLDDMDFVLDEILSRVHAMDPNPVFSKINPEKIGLFGHSLGGATAAQLGRTRRDIDAVAVIDGTMIGEQIALSGDRITLNPAPYPVPLLNLYSQAHYEEAQRLGNAYSNLAASSGATAAYDILLAESGHLNLTDLPLFSPALAKLLGTGKVDSKTCIETMNRYVLDFFDHTLKNAGNFQMT